MYAHQLRSIALWYLVNRDRVPNASARIETMVYRLAMNHPSSVRQKHYRHGLNSVARHIAQFIQEAKDGSTIEVRQPVQTEAIRNDEAMPGLQPTDSLV